MTLFGHLERYAFIDLINFVNNQTGTLFLHQAHQGRTLEMNLEKGQLKSLYADGFRIQEQMRVREIIYALISQYGGKFEFDNRKIRSEHECWLNMDLAQLLTQAAQESMIPEEDLPRPHDKFVASALAESSHEQLTDGPLRSKWQQIQPRLGWGLSAADLAGPLFYSERELRVTLYHLLTAGVIVPKPNGTERSAVQAPDQSVPCQSEPPAEKRSAAEAKNRSRWCSSLHRLAGTQR